MDVVPRDDATAIVPGAPPRGAGGPGGNLPARRGWASRWRDWSVLRSDQRDVRVGQAVGSGLALVPELVEERRAAWNGPAVDSACSCDLLFLASMPAKPSE